MGASFAFDISFDINTDGLLRSSAYDPTCQMRARVAISCTDAPQRTAEKELLWLLVPVLTGLDGEEGSQGLKGEIGAQVSP